MGARYTTYDEVEERLDTMLLGAHESVAGGLDKAFEHAAAHAGECIQIFTKNANQWREPPVGAAETEAFRSAHRAAGGVPIVAHGSYLVNLCSDRPDIVERSREALFFEMERCDRLGVAAIAFHPGASVGIAHADALDLVGEGIGGVLERTRGMRTRLCIENTAGQGSCLAWSLDEIAQIIERSGPESDRIGVCLDTQHMFAAGYDLRTAEGYDRFFAEFEEKIGTGRISAFHLNDSKKPLGQRVDRHDEIGMGEIGLYPFWRLVNDPRFERVPGVVELPREMALASLARLADLRGVPEPKQKKIVQPLALVPPPIKAATKRKR
jgi:deoxyribonuclease-4